MADTSFALYRKYRPTEFADVRNQDHIVKVLEGAIKKGTIPHALLFTGSRGTGKTTVARIFARAIGARDIDVYEIDAASNRGIDDIRALRESVLTLPYESPYKVYIIDEVHMLTKEAFNALLKTLEEPPEHVIFILATTEQDRLLPTIISRCQLFAFKAPTRSELREIILDVAKKERVKLAQSAADVIALAADGSYRDALGVLQKVMMASDDITLDDDEVALIVGAPKSALLAALLTALHTKSTRDGLAVLAQAVDVRVDMKIFTRLLLERVRMVILIRHGAPHGAALMESCSTEEQDLIRTYAADARSPINSHLLLKLLDAAERIGSTALPQLPLELVVVELSGEGA